MNAGSASSSSSGAEEQLSTGKFAASCLSTLQQNVAFRGFVQFAILLFPAYFFMHEFSL